MQFVNQIVSHFKIHSYTQVANFGIEHIGIGIGHTYAVRLVIAVWS
jgi:hypothetical protein